jgi:hypothetical protein
MHIDVDKTEVAEKSLDAFINSRSKAKEKANAEEESWRASDRRVRERRRRENRQGWLDFYEHMSRLHLGLAAEHANKNALGCWPRTIPNPTRFPTGRQRDD